MLLTAVLTVVLTFLLTGLIANRLVQGWQHRNWISQQRLADTQKDYESVQDLFDEIAGLAGKRHHRMVRLLASIRSFDADVTRQRFTEYDAASTEWNERLNAIFAKLTMYLQYNYTWRLEHNIHDRFVTLGSELEGLARQKISGNPIDRSRCVTVERGLNNLQATVFNFNRDILKTHLQRKERLYERPFNDGTLDQFPTWELLKTLFKPRVERQ